MPIQRITVALTGHESYDQIRVLRPLAWHGVKQALWDAGIAVDCKPIGELSISSLAGRDCLVLHGVATAGVMNLLRKIPCRFAIFQDDLMRRGTMPAWNPNNITEAQERVLDYCLEHACAIVATTKPLADELGYLEKTRVQGNLEDFDIPIVGDTDRMTRAAFVGGNSHAGDLELLNDLEWNGKTIIWSSCLPSARTAMYRDKMGNVLMKPDRQDWGWIQPTLDHERYGVWLKNVAPKIGIGLAPLLDCKFNRCKSILRFLEYTKCGWVTVCSEAEPYMGIPPHLLVPAFTSWSEAVATAADHPELAGIAWEWCRKHHSYQEHWRDWVDTYAWIGGKI